MFPDMCTISSTRGHCTGEVVGWWTPRLCVVVAGRFLLKKMENKVVFQFLKLTEFEKLKTQIKAFYF